MSSIPSTYQNAVPLPTTMAALELILDPIQTEDEVARPVIEAIRHQAAECLLLGQPNPLGVWIQSLAKTEAGWRNTDSFARVLSTDSIENWGEVLERACTSNQCANIRLLLATGRCCLPDLTAGIRAASEKGNIETVRILLDAGATDLSSALERAISGGRIELAKLLLAQPSAADPAFRLMALRHAAQSGSIAIIQELLKRGTPLEEPAPMLTPLQMSSDWECSRFLLDAGANPNARDHCGGTALHHCDKPAIARLLIARGAEVDARDNRDQTPLHSAYHWGRKLVARVLIEAGASLSARDNAGTTPRGCLFPSRESDWSDMP